MSRTAIAGTGWRAARLTKTSRRQLVVRSRAALLRARRPRPVPNRGSAAPARNNSAVQRLFVLHQSHSCESLHVITLASQVLSGAPVGRAADAGGRVALHATGVLRPARFPTTDPGRSFFFAVPRGHP